MPPMRPLRPHLQIASSRWGSRPQPGRLPRVQCRLFRVSETSRRISAPLKETALTASERERFLEQCSLARQKKPLLSKIWWTVRHIPWFLKELVYTVVRYTKWRMLKPRLPEKEGFVVKSRIGRFFYDILTHEHRSVKIMPHQSVTVTFHPALIEVLNKTMRPWGRFSNSSGNSMQPTFGGNPGIQYSSNAYNDYQDIKLGDVVCVLGPKRNYITCWITKRVAALEGDRIWTIGKGRMQYILPIKRNEIFALGDNPQRSTDSRHFGVIPFSHVRAKAQWCFGYGGLERPNHGSRPWLENKAIEHLAPGQNRPTEQSEKKTVRASRPRTNILTPAPPRRERKDPRKKT